MGEVDVTAVARSFADLRDDPIRYSRAALRGGQGVEPAQYPFLIDFDCWPDRLGIK